MRPCAKRGVTGEAVAELKPTEGASRRLAGAALAVAALMLAACTASAPPVETPASLPPPAIKPAEAEISPAALREHQRILVAYGGVYNDPRLQGMLEQTVDRLIAASERPDLHYRVTMLNSQSINAFALPTGQLYVTRGLIALANDESELASVLAHEMGHVLARHAAIREEQARQAALVNRVVTDVISDPEVGALALAKSKLALAGFSRAQEFEADAIGIGVAARAGYDPYGAVRFLTSMEHNSELRPQQNGAAINPRAPDFLSSHPATPERISNALANARQFNAPPPSGGGRDKAAYLSGIDGIVFGEDPSEGFVRGRRFLHPRLGFTFTAPDGFSLDNTAQAVLGVKHGGGQALRLDVVRVPAEQKLAEYLTSGWIEHIDPGTVEEVTINGFPGRHGGRQGRSMGLPAVRRPLRQRRLSLHLRREAPQPRNRPHFPRIDRHVPPHEPRRDRGRQAAAPPGGDRRAQRHGREAGHPDGGRRPARGTLPRAQRARSGGPAEVGQRGQDRR